MKNKEKEIEEMSRDLCHSRTCDIKKNGGNCYKYCNAYIYAFRAVNAGYRKASDVAREISQDIIEPLWNAYKNSTCQETVLLVALICETINNQLKKKYESEGEG